MNSANAKSVTVKAKWTLISYVQDYSYTGAVQTFTAPETGYYKIELWGAQGGTVNNSYQGGKGGHVRGNIFINKNTSLYFYIGGQGQLCSGTCTNTYSGGWNGGGNVRYPYDSTTLNKASQYTGTGGGATDIRVISGAWNNTDSLRSRIMVAGGGGGASSEGNANWYSDGGYAGGLTGGIRTIYGTSAVNYYGSGGTQTSGGSQVGCYSCSARGNGGTGGFGYGGYGIYYDEGSGGGSGWYGGGGNNVDGGGGGGSSYISGYTGCVAVTSTSSSSPKSGCATGTTNNACSITPYINPATNAGYTFTSTQMIAGNASMPNTAGTGNETGHSGNGYAKITWLGDTI